MAEPRNLLAVAPRLAPLIPRLASNHDGKVRATVAALIRVLKRAGLDFHGLAKALGCDPPPAEKAPESWYEFARWCEGHICELNEREYWFVSDMCARLMFGGEPSEKKAAWLKSIDAKLRKAQR